MDIEPGIEGSAVTQSPGSAPASAPDVFLLMLAPRGSPSNWVPKIHGKTWIESLAKFSAAQS